MKLTRPKSSWELRCEQAERERDEYVAANTRNMNYAQEQHRLYRETVAERDAALAQVAYLNECEQMTHDALERTTTERNIVLKLLRLVTDAWESQAAMGVAADDPLRQELAALFARYPQELPKSDSGGER